MWNTGGMWQGGADGTVPAGGSGTTVPGIGVLNVNTTSQATTGTIEEVLATYSLPANTLNANGKAIRITAVFVAAANGNSKITRIRLGGLGGTSLGGVTSTASGASFYLTATVIRTGANTQLGIGATWVFSASSVPALAVGSATDTAAIDIVATGETGTASGDLTFRALIVEVLN